MSAQHMKWPRVGETVWVVHHQHTWDAYNNHQYYPVPREVVSVGTDTVHLKGDVDRKLGECFISQEECKRACPAPHP